MRLQIDSKSGSPRLALVGFPVDFNASFLRGSAKAPSLIRGALKSDSSNLFSEDGMNLANASVYLDVGDIDIPDEKAFVTVVESAIRDISDQGLMPVSIGGDHSISFPILLALSRQYSGLTVVQFDAHPDLYDEFAGSRLSHACPFARVMEGGYAAELVQLGIRSLTQHQRDQASRFGVRIIEMKDWRPDLIDGLKTPIYVSFDLDALDPAYAPGVSHHEPGGFSVRQVLDVIQRLPQPIVGADIVEYNPDRDLNGVTAMVAAKIIKELAARMLGSN